MPRIAAGSQLQIGNPGGLGRNDPLIPARRADNNWEYTDGGYASSNSYGSQVELRWLAAFPQLVRG